MNIGFIADDSKKKLMQNFCIAYRGILSKNELYATGTTGRLIEEVTNLNVHKYLAGHLGGEQQIGGTFLSVLVIGNVTLQVCTEDTVSTDLQPDLEACRSFTSRNLEVVDNFLEFRGHSDMIGHAGNGLKLVQGQGELGNPRNVILFTRDGRQVQISDFGVDLHGASSFHTKYVLSCIYKF